MFIRLILAIGTKCSLAKGLGTQYRDVSDEVSFRGTKFVGPALLNRFVSGV